ncbi:hypothetical protein B1A99_34935 [Cohnella sp. CIP 111063]|uniref:hypothetical protein n=1 Tax=unclassified Cohnella TaxID=2636738 RepID=UPI000B8BBB8B|nr:MULTISPECIES: hypothetical protein [unclassified Cohnella]OXS52155.1 hypothetical protein B1A99_34935 [Cohnella sp. CIP 111063]PRX53400.1 hypothetical protein B0G52_1454 [Cohnella sp. SGD-V74]
MLSAAMIQQLYTIQFDHRYTKKHISRKSMKIIVDSIIEQICSHYFQIRPNGIQKLRLLINTKIVSINEEEDKAILRSLSAILREYSTVFSKTYSDHDQDFNDFLNQELFAFMKELTNHSLFRTDDNAIRLRSLLI